MGSLRGSRGLGAARDQVELLVALVVHRQVLEGVDLADAVGVLQGQEAVHPLPLLPPLLAALLGAPGEEDPVGVDPVDLHLERLELSLHAVHRDELLL